MSITSFQFILFFFCVLLVYYAFPGRIKPYILLVFSLVFYFSFGIRDAIILLCTSAIVWLGGILLDRCEGKKRLAVVAVEICLSAGALFVFKYSGFAIKNINYLAKLLHLPYQMENVSLVLPVGISFYVFSSISYTVDVYRRKISSEKNLFRFILYISYFPKIISGPIERFGKFKEQINKSVSFDFDAIKDGFLLMLFGYMQKLIVADRLAIVTSGMFSDPEEYQGITVFLVSIMYTLQIYWDFTGYTNIALGASKMLGIELTDNFHQPYLATSIRDFWKRWHISLTSWFRDYLYIPLGGNRKGKIRKYLNIMIVFLVSGLWHGAAWSYVIWGGLHGLYQVAEDCASGLIDSINKKIKTRTECFSYHLGQRTVTFLLVNFAWIFFGAHSTRSALLLIKNQFSVFDPWILFDGSLYRLGLDRSNLLFLMAAIIFMASVDIWREKMSVRSWLKAQNAWFRWSVYMGMIFSILIFGVYGSGYSSGSFIYNYF